MFSLVRVLAAVTFSGLFTGWCVRMLRKRKNPPKSELKLRGLPIKSTRKIGRPESTNFVQRRIQSTLETLMENGRMDDDATTRLVSRLDWWNQINRYLDMLKNTDESIDSVATGIESLMDYHQLHRSEVFKREMPGVPDDWITNCADTLSHRLDTE